MEKYNKPYADIVIFIPFCDGEFDILVDTIESAEFYLKDKCHIIAIDDCSDYSLSEKVKSIKPNITVLRNNKKNGGRSGLFITLSDACKYALSNFYFKIFMKIDTDALILNDYFLAQALEIFSNNNNIGLLGSYKTRCDMKKRSWFKWKLRIMYEKSLLSPFFRRKALWRTPIKKAKKYGYDLGENVLGGAYLLSYDCLQQMKAHGYFDYYHEDIRSYSKLGEDVICSLLVRACGYQLSDFATSEHPMAIALDYLPISKEEIISKKKSVIHSVKKGFNGESQNELRSYFKSFRV